MPSSQTMHVMTGMPAISGITWLIISSPRPTHHPALSTNTHRFCSSLGFGTHGQKLDSLSYTADVASVHY